MSSGGKKKEQAKAEDIASQAQHDVNAQAQQVRTTTQLSPSETALQGTLNPLLQQRLGQSGEQLLAAQGPAAQQYLDLVKKGLSNPGYLYPDTVGQQTQKALEEGLYPMLASRGINPQSPLAVSEGRIEARNTAIQNALNRVQLAQQDIGRGSDLATGTAALQEQARLEAANPVQAALQRQAGGAVSAAQIGAQGDLSKADLLNQQLSRSSTERQNEQAGIGQLIGTGLGAAAGSFAGPQGAMVGAQIGSQAFGGRQQAAPAAQPLDMYSQALQRQMGQGFYGGQNGTQAGLDPLGRKVRNPLTGRDENISDYHTGS